MPPDTLRVLLVEDNPAEADLIRELLGRVKSHRVAVTHADRLQRGLEILAAGETDLVLLDFSLPDSAGLSTYRRVAAVDRTVPVIILTNLDDDEMATNAVRDGAQDYLVKRSVDAIALRRAIRYAIERAASEAALAESEERYALAVRGANDGIWDWNLRTGHVYFSARWKTMLGYAEGEVGDRIDEWFDRVHPDEADTLRAAIAAHLAGDVPHFEQEHRIHARDGQWCWVLSRGLAVRDEAGRPTRMAGSLTDIGARKWAEEQLIHDAFHDPLTGLANRALFVDRLGLSLEQARRRPEMQFAVLFVDLDRFKNVNDSLGHSVGDDLVVEFSRRLADCLRPGDTVARLGGDEFAILLADIRDASDATRVAERAQQSFTAPFATNGHDVVLTASIGIALGPAGYDHPEEMLRDADTAMYRAKSAGRSCTQVFDKDMHRSAVALLKMEMDLRRAVDREEFVMYYQPIVGLGDGQILGFEGLVRWVHPERGLIRPESFLAVAEETGLIVPIGWWVLRESCRQVRSWQESYPGDPPLFASVNVSGKLFNQSDMVSRLSGILAATGLPPGSLRLEITENILMDHGDAAISALSDLRLMGVKLFIDDFGTGYSSLSYLQRFSYDTLKIDRTFVAGMGSQADAGVIVQTIVALGNMLGMGVIAEGVETPEQLAHLRAMNCPQAQGFWFSEPVDEVRASKLLQHHRAW